MARLAPPRTKSTTLRGSTSRLAWRCCSLRSTWTTVCQCLGEWEHCRLGPLGYGRLGGLQQIEASQVSATGVHMCSSYPLLACMQMIYYEK
ncbi:unnamed protein product [Urochloa humidicola]